MPKRKGKPAPKVKMVSVPRRLLSTLLNAAEDGIARCSEHGYWLSMKQYERAVKQVKADIVAAERGRNERKG